MPGGAAEDIPVCLVLGTARVMAIEKKKKKKKRRKSLSMADGKGKTVQHDTIQHMWTISVVLYSSLNYLLLYCAKRR